MWSKNALAERLNLKWPILQAPMGWLSTPALAAAVSNAGREEAPASHRPGVIHQHQDLRRPRPGYLAATGLPKTSTLRRVLSVTAKTS